jgi:hypothetical protein
MKEGMNAIEFRPSWFKNELQRKNNTAKGCKFLKT